MVYRTALFSMILNDPKPRFQGLAIQIPIPRPLLLWPHFNRFRNKTRYWLKNADRSQPLPFSLHVLRSVDGGGDGPQNYNTNFSSP